MTCRGDWMKLSCGDRVTENEGRHVGRVDAIFSGAYVKVTWEDNGYISYLSLNELTKYKEEVE